MSKVYVINKSYKVLYMLFCFMCVSTVVEGAWRSRGGRFIKTGMGGQNSKQVLPAQMRQVYGGPVAQLNTSMFHVCPLHLQGGAHSFEKDSMLSWDERMKPDRIVQDRRNALEKAQNNFFHDQVEEIEILRGQGAKDAEIADLIMGIQKNLLEDEVEFLPTGSFTSDQSGRLHSSDKLFTFAYNLISAVERAFLGMQKLFAIINPEYSASRLNALVLEEQKQLLKNRLNQSFSSEPPMVQGQMLHDKGKLMPHVERQLLGTLKASLRHEIDASFQNLQQKLHGFHNKNDVTTFVDDHDKEEELL